MAESKQSCLRKVICRLDFQKEISYTKELIDELKVFFKDTFPELKADDRVLFSLTIEAGEKITKEKRDRIYRLLNKEAGNTIVLEPDSIAVDLSTYAGFPQLQKLIADLMSKLAGQVGETKLRRVGLRYINELRLPQGHPLDWTEYISGSLISNLEFIENKRDVAQAMTVLEFAGESYRMRFQYGLFNSEFPNPIAKREFALDYDCFLQEDIPTSDVPSHVVKFHDEIERLFRESVTSQFLKSIGG